MGRWICWRPTRSENMWSYRTLRQIRSDARARKYVEATPYGECGLPVFAAPCAIDLRTGWYLVLGGVAEGTRPSTDVDRQERHVSVPKHQQRASVEDVTHTERFVQALTGCQSRLFTFILMLVPDEEQARDILQETNLVIWRKSDEFEDGTNFGSWACRIAHYQVLAYWRNTGRDRHIFNQEFVQDLVTSSVKATGEIDAKGAVLRQCLSELAPPQQELIRQRYAPGTTVESMAESLKIPSAAVSNRLYRLRQILRNCIREKLAAEGA